MARPALRCLARRLLVIGVALVSTGASSQAQSREEPVPKDAVEVIVKGCLKGRELTAMEVSANEELPPHVGAIFRLSAKGDLSRTLKAENGRLVSATGYVKRTALAELGMKVGGARVFIGGSPTSRDPTRDPARNPSARLFPMDLTALSRVADNCSVMP